MYMNVGKCLWEVSPFLNTVEIFKSFQEIHVHELQKSRMVGKHPLHGSLYLLGINQRLCNVSSSNTTCTVCTLSVCLSVGCQSSDCEGVHLRVLYYIKHTHIHVHQVCV